MFVKRDLLDQLPSASTLEAILLWGPRQVGKTTLLLQLQPATKLFLDDLALRRRAQEDPALTLENQSFPILIDEIQYAPNLFPEIKLRIDQGRRTERPKRQFLLTGSNKILLNQNIKESLAGRCSRFALSGFSIHELLNFNKTLSLSSILYRGGFPELYVRPELSPRSFLNDYVQSFVEKDIALSAGVEKLGEFQTLLQLLAARTGQFLQYQELSDAAGIDLNTVKRWISLLEQNMVLERVRPFSSNLSKRIVKMPKLYFHDTGLAARLQGHADEETLWNSPQAGSLFETLVFCEITKTRLNFLKDWDLYTWRTKEKDEIDFILKRPQETILLEAKLGIHGAKPFELDREAKRVFGEKCTRIVVTAGGEELRLSHEVIRLPIQKLADYLIKNEK